jgi:glycosyltransferase involved in cell wall biosynthesis
VKLLVCAPDIFSGDAVGNHCLGVARIAQTLDWNVEIYAQRYDAAEAFIHPIDDLFHRAAEDDTLFLSYSIFDPYLDRLLELRCRRICYFHGITEPGLLHAYEPKTADLCEQGLAQLPKLAKFDSVIANSRYTAQGLEDYMDAASITVIPPVFADMPAFKRVPAKRERSGDSLNLLVVGRVVPHKRVEDAIEVVAHLLERGINATLSVVGTMPNFDYSKFLFNHARKLSILDRIDFTGPLDDEDLHACYDKASALLSLSRHEGFCVPALEAMHIGIPALVRAGHAAAEVVGDAGQVFGERASTAAIAKVVADLFSNDQKLLEIRRRVERRGRELLRQSDPECWLYALNQQGD